MSSSNSPKRQKTTESKDNNPFPSAVAALPSIDSTKYPPPHGFLEWIEAHKKDLAPPVGNKMMYADPDCQFKVMIVGGPNTRTDYHVEDGEEWFYMVKGDMVLKIVDGGQFKNIVIREGESFLLPAGVPHSPQRMKDTIGLVVERLRLPHEMDKLRWYCQACKHIVYEEVFHCEDLGSQIKAVVQKYYKSEELRKCKNCGVLDVPPTKPVSVDDIKADDQDKLVIDKSQPHLNPQTHPLPFSFQGWVDANNKSLQPPVCNKLMFGKGAQFKVMVVGGPNNRTDYHIEDGEEWFYQLKGDMVLKVVDGGVFKDIHIKQGQCYLHPARVPHSPQRTANSVGLVIERDRRPHEKDGLRWYCRNPSCRKIVFEKFFHVTDLGTQLKPIIEQYYGDEKWRTCPHCKAVDTPPSQAS